MDYKSVLILGPTATGKTNLAVRLAKKFNAEIISADSRQVYKRMDLGTGKDLHEYCMDGVLVPYHLIDIVEPTDEFNLFEFICRYNQAFSEITKRNKLPFIVGGTGLYLHAIIKKYELSRVNFDERYDELNKLPLAELAQRLIKLKKNLHNVTDLKSKSRCIKAIIIAESEDTDIVSAVDAEPFIIGVRANKEIIKKRITERLKERLKNGMIDEVKGLLDEGVSYEKLEFFGLEYKFIVKYIAGELNYNDMFQKLNAAIIKFAKRQLTWFGKMEREGVKIHWIDAGDVAAAEKLIEGNLFDAAEKNG